MVEIWNIAFLRVNNMFIPNNKMYCGRDEGYRVYDNDTALKRHITK